MYKINFNHLFCFITIAKQGSISEASKLLNVTQPALSHQLRQLEEDLGQKLFDRKGRGLKINNFGKQVFNYANKIFRETENMLDSLETADNKIRSLKVGVISWLPEEYTFQFLKTPHLNPNIKLIMEQGSPKELINLLKQDKLDIVITDTPYTGTSEMLSSRKIRASKIVCIAHPSFDNQTKNFPEYLNGHKIANYHQSSQMRSLVDLFLMKNKLTPEITTVTNDIKLMLKFVSKSHTLAFVPMEAAKEYIESKKIKIVKTIENLTMDVWVITKEKNSFKKIISESFKNFNP